MYGLVFFLWVACKQSEDEITLIWKNDRAVGIIMPARLFVQITDEQLKANLKVVRSGHRTDNGILGDLIFKEDAVIFVPLIPFTPEYDFDILYDGKLMSKVKIPLSKQNSPPKLVAIYPQQDTLPENQLKLYLHFDKPMRTGNALDYITLLDKNKDTLHRVFLNLQPELWDTSGTVLTLWLDPGRIKRDLVLNRELGNPLKQSQSYTLIISPDWKDTHGIALQTPYTKQFVAGRRDGEIPDINKWHIDIPKAGSSKPLTIDTGEPLDHYLLMESISIVDANGAIVKGQIEVKDNDRAWKFTPLNSWKAQTYKLHVTANLEDLAGNNLNRVFDRDIYKDKQQNKDWFERRFVVK